MHPLMSLEPAGDSCSTCSCLLPLPGRLCFTLDMTFAPDYATDCRRQPHHRCTQLAMMLCSKALHSLQAFTDFNCRPQNTTSCLPCRAPLTPLERASQQPTIKAQAQHYQV